MANPINARQSTYDAFFAQQNVSVGIRESSFPILAKRPPAQDVNASHWMQKGSLSPYVVHGEIKEVLDRRTSLTNEEIAMYKTPAGIVALNQEGIELALDRRVALFFQQSILCYNMPFVFSTKGADDQIGSSQEIHLSNHGQKGGTVHKREAAHSSTIPTLLATPTTGLDKRTFVYLKGGSSHAQHNATIGMHVHVNGADELLDGKGDKGLRGTATKILNRVAEGLDPVQATKNFLKEFEDQAVKTAQNLAPTDTRKAVLEAYTLGIRAIAQQTNSDPTLFDRLIGVNINPDDPKEKILRETIYKSRYDIIRLEEAVESRIGKRISDAKKEMDKKGTGSSFLEYILLKEFAQTPQCQTLEKLFAKTAVIFEEEYSESFSKEDKKSFKTFQTKVRNLQEKNSKLIEDLKRELRSDFRELSSSEFAYRAKVFKDLRTEVRGWKQIKFCEQYQATTGRKVSQAWVSRMEQPSRVDTKTSYQTPLNQRTRQVSLQDAEDCAQTFGIDVGLFLPSLITSH